MLEFLFHLPQMSPGTSCSLTTSFQVIWSRPYFEFTEFKTLHVIFFCHYLSTLFAFCVYLLVLYLFIFHFFIWILVWPFTQRIRPKQSIYLAMLSDYCQRVNSSEKDETLSKEGEIRFSFGSLMFQTMPEGQWESLHCRDPFPLTVALSFWINPSECRPIIKRLVSEELISTIPARDKKDCRYWVSAVLKTAGLLI